MDERRAHSRPPTLEGGISIRFEIDDLDWALGELLHMTWKAKRAGILPHLYDPVLFSACLRLIHHHPFAVQEYCNAIWQRWSQRSSFSRGGYVRTLALIEAAEFLKMHPEEVRRRARLGQLPGAKAGKRWVFIVEDLAAYLRSLYAPARQALRVTLRKEVADCHSIAVARGGFDSPLRAASELDVLLGLATKRKPRSCTTA